MSYLLPTMNMHVAALLSIFLPFAALPFGSYSFGVPAFYASIMLSLWFSAVTAANCIRRSEDSAGSRRWLLFGPAVIALWWPLATVVFVARKLAAVFLY